MRLEKKSEYQNQTHDLFFNYRELLSEYKRLENLSLSGTYQGEPWNQPNCTKPKQMIIYEYSLGEFFLLQETASCN